MIESEFDRVIRGENNNYGTNKKSKLKVIIAIIIFIILVGVSVWGYMSYSQYKTAMPKIKFFEYLSKTNIEQLTDMSLFKEIYYKMNENSYTLSNNVSFFTGNEEDVLSNLNAEINYYRDNENNLNKTDVIINNYENEVIKITGLMDNENIGIKSDDIVVKYVGSKFENLNKVFNISETQENEETKEKITFPNKEMLNVYKDILNSKLLDEQFSIEKNVRLTEGNSSVETTLYQLSFNKEEIIQIITELQDTLMNDDEFIKCLITGEIEEQEENVEDMNFTGITPTDALNLVSGYKLNVSIDTVKEEIENNFTRIFEVFNSIENLKFNFDIYVSDSKVIKEIIKLENLFELTIDFETISENENYVKAIVLYGNEESKNGLSISLNRKNNNVTTDFVSEISLVEKGQINNKVIVEIKLEGNSSSTNVNNNTSIKYSDTENEYELKINSKLDYKLVEKIEKLDSDNCLFLDELDDETKEIVKMTIYTKAEEVVKNKINDILNPTIQFNNQIVNMDGENEEEKEVAKNKLINAVKEEMKKAQDEEREYALSNLQDLKIENSTVSVMVNENIAIIAVDGYTFYIDPNFNLTEE